MNTSKTQKISDAGNRKDNQQNEESPRVTFMKKLNACTNTFDYSNLHKDIEGKARRFKALKFMNCVMKDDKSVRDYVVPQLNKVMAMIEKNIFRALPNI